MLLPDSLYAKEELSRDFEFTVEMLDRMASIDLVRVDGSVRYFNGYVFEFRRESL